MTQSPRLPRAFALSILALIATSLVALSSAANDDMNEYSLAARATEESVSNLFGSRAADGRDPLGTISTITDRSVVSGDGGLVDPLFVVTAEHSCASHGTCSECAESSWACHWCEKDDACHAVGSAHGCAKGATCRGDDDDDDDKNGGKGGDDGKTNATDHTCASHMSCQECASSSWECHWCAHDQACHSVGSRFGCLRGERCDATPQPGPPPAPAPAPVPEPSDEKGCASHETCHDCATSSWGCHWCAHDGACHAVGSIHGCLRGESCDAPSPAPAPSPKDDGSDKGCASHSTCIDCDASSWGCHWCAHDNACHRVGSLHGCTFGVDCYSNDRCTRKSPEPIRRHGPLDGLGVGPALAVAGAGMLLLGCATACVSVAGCAAGRGGGGRAPVVDHQRLTFVAAEMTEEGGGGDRTGRYEPPAMGEGDVDGDASEETALLPPSSDSGGEACGAYDGDDVGNQGETGEHAEVREVVGDDARGGGEGKDDVCDDDDDDDDDDEVFFEPGRSDGSHDEEPLDEPSDSEEENDEEEPEIRAPLLAPFSVEARTTRGRRGRSGAARCYVWCKICYVIAVVVVLVAVCASLVFFPRAPVYNVCNDQVAWKSIITGITSRKMEASVQLLISVSNPNYMSLMIDSGSGTFKHDGVDVGLFELPETTISAMSITDILVAITFSPNAAEGFKMASEYRKGTLKFAVDAVATVTLPFLAGYTTTGGVKDLVVYANDPALDDRHLCLCSE